MQRLHLEVMAPSVRRDGRQLLEAVQVSAQDAQVRRVETARLEDEVLVEALGEREVRVGGRAGGSEPHLLRRGAQCGGEARQLLGQRSLGVRRLALLEGGLLALGARHADEGAHPLAHRLVRTVRERALRLRLACQPVLCGEVAENRGRVGEAQPRLLVDPVGKSGECERQTVPRGEPTALVVQRRRADFIPHIFVIDADVCKQQPDRLAEAAHVPVAQLGSRWSGRDGRLAEGNGRHCSS
mmetsp:Transcript_50027/g.124418  ORF Transcript_50027/g.124418 Transcript_50027/m.124418 type:complete len:241 (-) Transcript_50027:16-738(-)